MVDYRPRIEEATEPGARMDALCEFIEFWLGPRQASCGEPAESLAAHALPMPLHRLYEFAGRWPRWDGGQPIQFAVPIFSTQDDLIAVAHLRPEKDGKITFLQENQGVWSCRTLTEGEDPPVWCVGDQTDEHGGWFTGERLLSDSLAHFLTGYVLQELTLGSRMHFWDERLVALFEAQKEFAVPVWTQGKYVHDSPQRYFLWGHVLAAELLGEYSFSANDEDGIRFLTENQSPIDALSVIMGRPWMLDIESDGSARLRYSRGRISECVHAPPDTYDFSGLLQQLFNVMSDKGHYETNPVVSFCRKGQSGGEQGRYLHDKKLATSLF